MWKLQLPFVGSDTSALMRVWMSAPDLENDSSHCRHRTCEKPLTPLRIWQHIAGEREHAVNMLGSKHSCGRLLIGELASWGSKHMRQLRSDSCCVAGGADELGLSCVAPLFINADKRSEVLHKTKAKAPMPTRCNYWEELSSPLKV